MRRIVPFLSLAAMVCLGGSSAQADIIIGPSVPVTFSSASADFSQTSTTTPGTFNPDKSIDGIYNTNSRGWAVSGSGPTGNLSSDATAYFTLSGSGLSVGAEGSNLMFELQHNDISTNSLMLGHYRLSATTSAGPIGSGSTWTELAPILASRLSGSGIMFNPSGGPTNSVLYTSFAETNDTSFVTAFASPSDFASNITGIRLEAFDMIGNGLPGNGPGTSVLAEGNFVLTEFNLFAAPLVNVPEPSTLALFGVALGGLGFLGYRQRRR